MVNPNYRRAQSAYDQGNADADLFGGRVRRRAGVQRDIQRADLGMQAGAELDAARNTAKAEMTDPFLSAASTRNQRLGQDTEVRKALAGTLGRVVGSDNPAMADPDAMDRMIRQLGPMILEGKMPGAAPAQDTVTADTLSQQFPATQYSVEDILDAVEGSPEELADLETQLLSKGYRRR